MMAADVVISDGTSLVIHSMNQSFAANNTVLMQGQAAWSEANRFDYLIGKNQMSSVQALGFRTATESGSGRERNLDSTTPT